MKLPKSPKLRKYVKIPLFILISLLVGGYLLILGYSYFFEQDKIAIDRYNFEQLEKAKILLEDPGRKQNKFNNLREFNLAYNTDIQSKKDCYYVSSYNGDQQYIFGFKFVSLFYKISYFREYYIYPKYDTPYHQRCYGLNIPGEPIARCDYDDGFGSFVEVVNNPCVD